MTFKSHGRPTSPFEGSARLRTVWRRIASLGMMALGLTAAVASGAEQKIPREQLTVRETIDVRVVHLDAVVTDRSSRPLEDLEPADFDLRIDGERVEVTGVSQGRELRETVGGRLTIIVLIDERHLVKEHRDRVLAEIGEALVREMQVHPTWVAVTSFSEELVPLLAPTRDVAAVRRAIREAIEAESEVSESLRVEQRMVAHEVRDLLRGLAGRGTTYRYSRASMSAVATRVRVYGQTMARDTRQTVAKIESLVEALSFVPGRKAVLLISDGLARTPLDLLSKTLFDRLVGGSVLFEGDDIVADSSRSSVLNDPGNRPTGSDQADNVGTSMVIQVDDGGAAMFQQALGEFRLGPELDHLAALANTHRVTFYPLKPPVPEGSLSGLAERAEEKGSITALSDMTTGLQGLADQTGGLAFVGSGAVAEFLSQARVDISYYYSIRFKPPDSMWNFGIRELELKVRRRKAIIRHRASYVPLTVEQSLSSRAWGTLLFDWQENLHGLDVQTSVEALDEERYSVEILASLPIGELELVENGTNVEGAYRMVVQLRNQDGVRLRPQHYGFVVTIPRKDLAVARTQLFEIRTRLSLLPGVWDMAVGLWEENSGTASYITRRVEVAVEAPVLARIETPIGVAAGS